MLDINKIRFEKKQIETALYKRNLNFSFDEVLELDDKRKTVQIEIDNLRALRKKTSFEISEIKKENKKEDKNANKLITQMKNVGDEINELEVLQKELKKRIFNILSFLPNIPDEDLQAGDKKNNKVIKTFLNQKNYDFNIKHHFEISKNLNLIDYDRGIKISGEGSWIYKNIGAELEWALINFFIDFHLKDNWEFLLVPHILNYECGFTAGQFPKFENEEFSLNLESKNKKFMLPTSETALISIHMNEILDEDDLPKKYFSYTPCYRKESGSSRIEERGTVRGHQFNKVEMVQYTHENDSNRAFEEMLERSERLMQNLDLHYQVSKLAAADCSFSACRTYDIEVWLPSIKIYKEVSSVSNCKDFQSRRGNIKYRDKNTKKLKFLHTLNASGLATSRLFPAILEQYQQSDGSVVVPKVLRPYLKGVEVIKNN
ncbi:MAG: serine--tRNA ligase [Oscillospiraceae bacterium]|jgi:seryl-tRNA synthetase|nr:serine--tRNA ligase [Oscillospiraceae bacterium]